MSVRPGSSPDDAPRRCRAGRLLRLLALALLATVVFSGEPNESLARTDEVAEAPPEAEAPPIDRVQPVAVDASGQRVLRVATKPFEPFVFQTDNGRFEGFSIELWEQIASRLDARTEYVGTDSVRELLTAVRDGEADVGIAGITITSEREQDVDFAYPFYRSGLQIMVRNDGSGLSVTRVLSSMFSPGLLKFAAFGFVLLIASAHLMWLAERRVNPRMFPGGYLSGMWHGIWWAVVTVTTVGYGDHVPRSVIGRVVAMSWMWVGIVLFSFFTASITSQLTVQSLEGEISHPHDLPGHTVATVRGTTAVDYLRSNAVMVYEADTIEDAAEALLDGDVEAVVFDAPVLQYKASRVWKGRVRLVGPVFEAQSYGIALPEDSPMREELSRIVLELTEDGTYTSLHEHWFGLEQ